MGQEPERQEESAAAPDKRPKRLVHPFHEAIRERHYSRRTGQAYWHWVRNVVAATQNQALSALLFLYAVR